MEQLVENYQGFLLEASKIIAEADSLNNGLKILSQNIIKSLDTTYCCFMLLNKVTNQFQMIASGFTDRKYQTNWTPSQQKNCLPIQETILERFFLEGKPVIYPENKNGFEILNCLECTANIPHQLKSAIIVPLKVKEKALGLCIIGEMRSSERKLFSDAEIFMIHTLSNQVSTLIEKISLYETVKTQVHRIDNQNHLLSALDEASLQIRAVDDSSILPHEIIGNAVRLIKRNRGCFLVYKDSLQKLEISGIMNCPNLKIHDEVDLNKSWLKQICHSGENTFIPINDESKVLDPFIITNNLCPGIVIPIQNQGLVEALMIIGNESMPNFTNEETDVLNRFAAQASLAIHTSKLINSEQRIFEQFSTLKRISDYVQQSNDLEKMLHVILTGVTAGYGLGFNRAILLLIDEGKKQLRETLSLGHKSKLEAEKDWKKHHQNKLEDFDEYLKWLKSGKLIATPLHKKLTNVVFPFSANGDDIFSVVLREQCSKKVDEDEFRLIPEKFSKIFQPLTPIVFVPLISNHHPIGLIVVDNKFSHTPITDVTINTLQTFANTAAIAYEKEKHLREIKKEAYNRNLLYRISQELSTKKEIDQILSTLLDGGIQLLKVEMAVAHLMDEMTGEFNSYSAPKELTKLFTEPRKDMGLTSVVMSRNDYLYIPDTAKDKRVNPATIELGIRAMVGFPLRVRGKVIGALFFNSRKKQPFHERELALVSLMIAQSAVTMENARVFTSSEKNAAMRKALVLISQNLTETPQTQLQMEIIWQFVKKQFNAPIFYIGFYDDIKKEIDFQIFYDMYKKQAGFKNSLTDQGNSSAVGTVITTGKPLIWNSESTKDLLVNQLNLKLNTKGSASKSSLIYPLQAAGKVIGVIAIQSDRNYAWDEIEHSAFQSLAQLVSVSIQNSSLIQEINEGNALLEAAFSASKDITVNRDPDQTLDDIVQLVCTVMDAFRAKVVIMDQDGNPQYLVSHGYDEKEEQTTIIRSNGISHQVITTKQAVFIENLINTGVQLNPAMYAQGVRAASCIPLEYRETCRGVLWVDFKTPRRFTDNDKKTLQLFANQATTAYENARQFRELSYMQQAAETLSSTFSLTDTLNQIARSAQDVLRVQSAAIWSYDHQRKRFNLEESVASGIPDDLWKQYRKEEIISGHSAQTILDSPEGWIGVKDINDTANYPFLGKSTQSLLSKLQVKSFQGIRLEVGEEILGILYLNYTQIRSFEGGEDKKSARTFANHAALALKNAHLMTQISNAHRIAGAVANLTVLGEIEQTKDSIVNGTLVALDCDLVSLFSYDQECKQFDFPPKIVGVWDESSVLKANQVEHNSVPYKIIQKGEFYVTEDTPNDSIMGGEFTRREQILASVGCPLIIRDPSTAEEQIVGVMCVNYRSKHQFMKEELEEIKTFAYQAGIAIYNALLYKRLQQRVSALKTLNEAGQTIIQSLELEHILTPIAQQAWRLTGEKGKHAASASIVLVKNNIAKFIAGYPEDEFSKLESKFKDGINLNFGISEKIGMIGTAIKTGTSQMEGNVKTNPVYLEIDQNTVSELVVPIKFADKVIGAINVEHNALNIFDKDDLRDLESLAAFAGIAIEHANKYNTLKELNAYIGNKTATEWVRMVSESWGHSIGRDSGTAFAIIERMRRNLTKNNLTTLTEDIQDLKTIIEKIQSTRMVTPLTIEDADSDVEINQLLKTYLDRKFKQSPHQMIRLCYAMQEDLDLIATVRASMEWLRRAFEILADNAVDAMISADSPDKRLTIITKLINDKIQITFKDTGPGIPEEFIPYIGIKPIKSKKGSGVGLTLASNFVQSYKGQLFLDKTGPDGTEISIILPAQLRGN